jgi:ADP-L-glycero-D-manno-heptose 6-epimerase
MKLLITGSRGFIGKNFVDRLVLENIPFVEYDHTMGYKSPYQLDFSDITHCVHLGAISSTTETNVQKVLDSNLTWAICLFELCVEKNIHFQWSSSAAVYGTRSPEQGPFKVTDKCNPANIYAFSKFLLEQYVMNRQVVIVKQGFRYFNVYGPNEQHKNTQASPYTQFEKQALETGTIKVFKGSENFYRDFVSVSHVIDTHLNFLNNPSSGIINVGTGIPRSFMSVAEEIANKYNAKITMIDMPENLKNHYQTYTCADMNS